MPDIQTEMKKILQAWDQPETPQQHQGPKLFKPTNNVSQQTFNFVRDNAGCTRKDAIRLLTNQGHKKSSVSSLIGQMLRQGHIWRDSDGLLRPNGKEYTPIKSARTIINREKKAKVVKPAKTFKVKTSEPAKVEVSAPTTDRVQEIMNTISLPEAKRLYNSLATYFGIP